MEYLLFLLPLYKETEDKKIHMVAGITRLKEFAARGALFKNETRLSQGSFIYWWQVKETRDSYPKLCLQKGD